MGENDRKLVTLPAAYVFARRNAAKPSHVQPVRQLHRPALCHNGCGLYYVPPVDFADLPADAVCPDCQAAPKPWRLGPPEEIDVAVHMAFGNVVDMQFLRAQGTVSRRIVTLDASRGIVKRVTR